MRPGQGNRRPRRGGGGHSHHGGGRQQHRSAVSFRNQIFDSNGPDARVRGNAFQVHEKYLALAKDALSSGDRVLAENYLQHAEHYYRIVEAINEAATAEQRARQAYMAPGEQPSVPQGNSGFYNSVGDMASAPPVQAPASAPPASLPQGPVTMDSVAASGEEGEDEDSRPQDGMQAAGGGRR